jgi:hypothetical protein
MIQTVNLSPSNPSLKGKYAPGSTVLVLCDASDAAFTVQMPSARESQATTFILKKTDSTSNAVTLNPIPGQNIDGESSYELSEQNQSITLISDLKNYYLSSNKANSGVSSVYGLLHRQLINNNLIIPAGFSFISADSIIGSGVTVTIDGTWVVL